MRTPILLTAGALVLATLTGCGGGGDQQGQASSGDTRPAQTAQPGQTGKIAVAAGDTTCEVASTELPAGTSTFTITNTGTKITEFYVYGADGRVMGEVEDIAPGVSRDMIIELAAGTYETACKPGMVGKGIRGPLKVTGDAAPAAVDAKLTQATESYRQYVKSQTDELLTKSQEFVDAVKAGDIDKAKELFPVARTYWERIEPVAEIFGDLDPAIDARENDVAEGEEWTGFHRIEKDLWVTKDISEDGELADKLMADIKEIAEKANSEKLTAVSLGNGAKELLDEVATGKITGEEDRYSHTDLWDFAANLEGSRAAITALRPITDERDPELGKTLDEKFAAAEKTLAEHRDGDGWMPHDKLSKADLKKLSDVINALAEPISQVSPLVAR